MNFNQTEFYELKIARGFLLLNFYSESIILIDYLLNSRFVMIACLGNFNLIFQTLVSFLKIKGVITG